MMSAKHLVDWNWSVSRTPTRRGGAVGGNALERHFWLKEGIANGFSRMNLKLDLGFGLRFWLRLDLPDVPVWPGPSRFKCLSRCPVSVKQNVPEFHFSEIFKINSNLMMHCYEIIPS